jgi:phage shock protein PspC (stress-responsive transcriptional regulator)
MMERYIPQNGQREQESGEMNMADGRKLYRSRDNRMIAGVLGGIAEHFGWDPTMVRVAFVLLSIISAAFPGGLVYLVMWLIIPERGN